MRLLVFRPLSAGGARRLVLSILGFAVISCGGGATDRTTTQPPPVVYSISAVSGQSQDNRPTGTVADSLIARVVDGSNKPAASISVSWTVTGPATLGNATTVTDGSGLTGNAVVLGNTPGVVTVTAAIDGGSSTTYHIASIANEYKLDKAAGDNQAGVIGLPLGDSLAVRLTDKTLQPVAAATITWTAGSNHWTSVTDATGTARLAFTAAAASATIAASYTSAANTTSTTTFTVNAFPQVACTLTAPDVSGLHWENEGPTDYSVFAQPIGNLKAVMLFVDFSDAPATESTNAYSDAIVPDAEDFYREASYGKMSLDITTVPKWYRMSKASSTYGFAGRAITFAQQRAYLAEAIALADPDVDFSKYSHVYVVASKGSAVIYSPGFIAFQGSGIEADGRELRYGATLGTDLWAYSPSPNYGAHILAHETGHTFGMPDLYTFATVSDYYQLYQWAGGWDIMSWTVPGGHFYAWHKKKFGWLSSDQSVCFEHGRAEVVVSPTETIGGVKLVGVRVDASHAIALEVRSPMGHDAFAVDKGVLIYRVDATVPTGGSATAGPIMLFPAVTGSDSTIIRRVGPLYDATFDIAAGKPATFMDAGSGVSVALRSTAQGSYRLVVGRP